MFGSENQTLASSRFLPLLIKQLSRTQFGITLSDSDHRDPSPCLEFGWSLLDSPHLFAGPAARAAAEEHPSQASVFSLPESIKLGLGDFIFYSVLMGRAAMYDFFTVFACYLAIIAGEADGIQPHGGWDMSCHTRL